MTPSLVLRPFEPWDVDPIFEIQGDREAMRHTFSASDRSDTSRFLESYAARYVVDGYAPWIAVLRSKGRVVGWGGLNRDPNGPHWGPEVAYFIHPAYWGRGLATEIVEASIRLAFEDIGVPEVFAFSRPDNHGSRRVLEKSGFTLLRFVEELERDQFRLNHPNVCNWRTAPSAAASPAE